MANGDQDAHRRLGSIDALRGFAALYVFFFHMALIPQPALDIPEWFKPFIMSGATGVSLFFIVSAFTLCHSMRSRAGEPRAAARFYVRRVFRIVPLFYAWIAATCVRDALCFHLWHSPQEVLLNISFAFNFVPGQEQGFVWASWTLAVEMTFYLFFPLILHYVRDLPKAVVFLLGSLLLSSMYRWFALFLDIPDASRDSFMKLSFLNMLPVFACGLVAYFLYDRYIAGRAANRTSSLLLIVAAAFGYNALLTGKLEFLVQRAFLAGNHLRRAVAWRGELFLGFSRQPRFPILRQDQLLALPEPPDADLPPCPGLQRDLRASL